MAHVIGIDLGTTNSCVAIMSDEGPEVISNRGGYKTTPSMVAFTESGKRLVGHIAKRQAVTNAENTVYASKRLIGRNWNSPQTKNAVMTCSYEIVEGPHTDLRIRVRDNTHSVPEISSMILQEMKVIAEDFLGEPVEKAVITVPAYFNDSQRQATKDAGAIAALDVVRIINEPTAAALAYGAGKGLNQTIAVYDLGGGTFDISILELTGCGVFKVIATTGDTYLGGEDFDGRIIGWLLDEFLSEYAIDLREDRMALQRLKDAAEKAKCELSNVNETEINLPFIHSTGQNRALHLQRSLTRTKFEELTHDLVEQTLGICRMALREAQLDVDEIDEVVLVGGMTRVPAVARAVTKLFGRQPNKGVHPDEVVALGAAIQGASLISDDSDIILLDVTPHALGIVTYGEVFEELIAKNTTVPTSQSKVFTTSRDNQTAVKILVMQGESKRASENELLGEFILSGLREAPKGEVQVEVTFSINTDGIVSASARDIETGLAQSIQVVASSGLTPEELGGMIASAHDYLLERRRDEATQAVSQRIETLLANIENILPVVESQLSTTDFGKDALGKARQIVGEAREAVKFADSGQLQLHADNLERTQRMFKGMLSRSR